jgi:tetratricopeptide (TPR) repeat protein/SAM-dependent methyltransferase
MNRKERRAAGRRGGEVPALLAAAVRHHQAGELVPAEAGYRAVLARDPRHGRALYYLGVICAQTGRHAAACDLIGQAAALDPRNAEVRYNLAAAHHGAGRLDDAIAQYRHAIALNPRYAEAHMNLGNALAAGRDALGAVACYDAVLALDPASATAHYNAANVLARTGDLAAAAARYRAAIALQPGLAEAHNNLANVLRSENQAAQAEAAYRRALALRPDYADAHNNLGAVLVARGAADEAIAHYRAAVRARPDFAEAHANLGLALVRAGERDEAVKHAEQAVALDPDSDALLNLARQLFAAGDVAGATAIAASAARVKETPDARYLFAIHAGALADGEQAEPYRDLIARALREGWAPAGELERVSAQLVRRNPVVATVLAGMAASVNLPDPAQVAAIADDRLLRSLMAAARICDPDLERLLGATRRALLECAVGASGLSAPALDFAADLARQCFVNEYVFAQSAEERAAAERLAAAIAGMLDAGREIAAAALAVLACYRPLHAVPAAHRLLSRTWPPCVAGLLAQQISEPAEEAAIGATLTALTAIDDDVSRRVREQYEANPYPRWVAPMPAVTAAPLGEHLRRKFPLAPLRPPAASDILIAGCGTGAHAIDIGRRVRDARVLAIDLSRASLAYAARKSRALGLPIDYAQADILELAHVPAKWAPVRRQEHAPNEESRARSDSNGTERAPGGIGRTFDLIEASGVLHHLADPFAGWRILLARLAPAGVMSVGLYSQLARADVNAARAFIAEHGYRADADDIRRCRQDILALPPDAPARSVARLGDFYSLSGCRDLLFHVQEHQHTLPEIAAFIAQEDLQFLGFEIDQRVLGAYLARNPDDPAAVDLDRWHRFELDNPGVFAGMYQFAVQAR